jgi:uncharacterized protein YjiS (DUF1127 family)
MITVPRIIGVAFGRWAEGRRRRAAIRELRAVCDRTLKDMGLTRGEIVAAVDGRIHRGKQVRPRKPEPPARRTAVEALGAAALQGQPAPARQVRAELIASLLRRGLGRLVRLLRGAAPAPLRQNPQHVIGRGLSPLRQPPGHDRAQPTKERSHGPRSNHAA